MKAVFVLLLAAVAFGFKLMTFNIKNGHNMAGNSDIAGTAKVIKNQGPIIVGLQEVDVNTNRNPHDQPTQLAEKTGLTYHHFHKTIPFQGGKYGVATLSKVKPIATAEFAFHAPGSAAPACSTEDIYCRGVSAMKIELAPQHYVWYLSTHLGLNSGEALTEVKQIATEFIPTLAKPYDAVFVVGDFNVKPDSSTYKYMVGDGGFTDMWKNCGSGNGYTYDAESPHARIDFIFQKPLKYNCTGIEVINTQASDHRPLVATFADL